MSLFVLDSFGRIEILPVMTPNGEVHLYKYDMGGVYRCIDHMVTNPIPISEAEKERFGLKPESCGDVWGLVNGEDLTCFPDDKGLYGNFAGDRCSKGGVSSMNRGMAKHICTGFLPPLIPFRKYMWEMTRASKIQQEHYRCIKRAGYKCYNELVWEAIVLWRVSNFYSSVMKEIGAVGYLFYLLGITGQIDRFWICSSRTLDNMGGDILLLDRLTGIMVVIRVMVGEKSDIVANLKHYKLGLPFVKLKVNRFDSQEYLDVVPKDTLLIKLYENLVSTHQNILDKAKRSDVQ